jgi:uncharacterized membrane protein
MNSQYLALLIGGILPAVFFGVSGVIQKSSAKAAIGTGPYLMVVGLVVLGVGAFITIFQKDWTINRTSGAYTALYAFLWSMGVACVAIALSRYQAQISQLVPLYNMNTLVAVILGLILFGEWKDLNLGRLFAATALTIAGGILAATAIQGPKPF